MSSPIVRFLNAIMLVSLCFSCAHGADAPPPASISGPVAWSFQTGGKEINAAPIVADGVVYCGSSAGTNGTTGQFFALDAATGQQLWKFKARFPISCRAAVQGDTVCFESGNTLYGLDVKTGQERWKFVARPFRPIASMDLTDYHRSSPVIEGNTAFFGDDWGNLNGVDITTGALTFQFTTATARPIRATPVVKDGIVCFGDWEGEVYAVSIADKKLLWQHTTENMRPGYGAVVSEFVIDGGLLYYGSQHDIFTPLVVATGKPAWKFVDAKRTYLPSTPLLHKGNVIIGTTVNTNSVLCLNQGNVVWSFKAEGIFFTKPVLHGSTLIINSTNFGKVGYLYLLDVETGKLINKLTIGKASPSAPAIDGDKLYLGAGDGCIYALKLAELLAPPVL